MVEIRNPNHKLASQPSLLANTEGFTLIEIGIAIFLLAVSLTILLGLQSSVVSRAIDDRHRLQAMLLARRVLSGIETGDMAADPQEISTPALQFLGESARPEDEATLKDLVVNMKVEPWTIPGYDDLKIRRINLAISWNEDPESRVSIFYFVPEEEESDNNQ